MRAIGLTGGVRVRLGPVAVVSFLVLFTGGGVGNRDIRGGCEKSSGGCRLAPGVGCFLLFLGWFFVSFSSLL